MNFRKSWVLAGMTGLAGFAVAGCGVSNPPVSASSIAHHIIQAQSRIKTSHSIMSLSIKGLPTGSMKQTIHLWTKSPDMARSTVDINGHQQVISVSNGHTITILNQANNTYMKIPVPKGSALGAQNPALLTTALSHILSQNHVSLVNTSAQIATHPTYELKLTPKKANHSFGFSSMTLWIDKQTYQPLAVNLTVKLPGGQTMNESLRYLSIQDNIAVPAGTFNLQIPPGAHKMAIPGLPASSSQASP